MTQAQIQGLGEFAHRGFTLEHLGCEVVLLLHGGELVGRFYQTGATEESLQAECSKHLVIKHGWDGFAWGKGFLGTQEGKVEVTVYCQHPGCNEPGTGCEMPWVIGDPIGKPPEYEYYCAKHAFEHGYCYMCGHFWAGYEGFDFDPGHLCPNCRSEMREEEDEDGEEYYC